MSSSAEGAEYRDRLRLRACGLLIQDEKLLLVQIHSPVQLQPVWMPPGGEVEFGESIEACLEREFREETGLEIRQGPLLFVNEMIEEPFHAVELYYRVRRTGGDLRLGSDPEQREGEQLLKDLRWVPLDELGGYELAPENLSARLQQAPGADC